MVSQQSLQSVVCYVFYMAVIGRCQLAVPKWRHFDLYTLEKKNHRAPKAASQAYVHLKPENILPQFQLPNCSKRTVLFEIVDGLLCFAV